MAKLIEGIFGPISGKLGPVVGAVWMGIPYLRMSPNPTREKKPRTEAQLANEQKFKFANDWLVPFHPFLEVGFQQLAIRKTAIAAGFSANYREVFTGTWPDLSVHCDRLKISLGNLPGLENMVITRPVPGRIALTWKAGYASGTAFDDQVMLVVYSPDLAYADGRTGCAIRRDESCGFNLHPKLEDQALEVYVAVISSDRKKISDSVYLGRVEP